jgi:hypothetical protein
MSLADAELTMIVRWCMGVIALRWWQARQIPAGSKIVKEP